jgi:hypothetical protein
MSEIYVKPSPIAIQALRGVITAPTYSAAHCGSHSTAANITFKTVTVGAAHPRAGVPAGRSGEIPVIALRYVMRG